MKKPTNEPTSRIAQGADKYIVRFPDGMRDRIAAEAKAANRSMNAEIVARLEKSLDYIDGSSDLMQLVSHIGDAAALGGVGVTVLFYSKDTPRPVVTFPGTTPAPASEITFPPETIKVIEEEEEKSRKLNVRNRTPNPKAPLKKS